MCFSVCPTIGHLIASGSNLKKTSGSETEGPPRYVDFRLTHNIPNLVQLSGVLFWRGPFTPNQFRSNILCCVRCRKVYVCPVAGRLRWGGSGVGSVREGVGRMGEGVPGLHSILGFRLDGLREGARAGVDRSWLAVPNCPEDLYY